jgi:hypothetical protein
MAGGCLLLNLLDQQIQLLLLLLLLVAFLTCTRVLTPTARHSQKAHQTTPLQDKLLQL